MPFPRARHRASRPLLALAVAGSLLLGGCSDDEPGAEPRERREVLHSPLTGLPVKGRPPKHPVIAVKIDNSAGSAPQVGLGSASMVVEELVEGGITRLAAFYWTDVPRVVGPVRSMRATDIGIVRPLDAVLVASGGAPVTVSRVKNAGIDRITEGETGYYREDGRVAPYNLFMRLGQVARTLEGGRPPAPYLRFSDSPALPKGEPARGLTAMFSPSSSTTFAYRDGRYVNTDTLAAAGDEYVAESVLVLRVSVGDAGYLDPGGNPVPETIFDGQGEAMIFTGGRVVRGTWSKAGLDAQIRLEAGGKPVRLPPGKVWIELVPATDGSVTVTK